MMFSYMNFVITFFVHVLIGYDSAHFVRYSTAVIMYLAPMCLDLFGKCPTKSISQILKGRLELIEFSGISSFHNG
jgi:hypothetical protein